MTLKKLLTLGETNQYSNEMSILHCPFRLNLEELRLASLKKTIRRVIDLKGISEGNLEKFGVAKKGDQKRIMSMITGEDSAKKGFSYMSHQSMRSFLSLFLKNTKEIEALVSLIPEDHITEFHLRDVFEKDLTKKYEVKLEDMLVKVRNFVAQKKVKKIKEIPKKYPKETPLEILERLNMQQYIPKFIEHDVWEPEFFYKLELGNLKGDLGVDNYGLRKMLMKEIEEFNKKGVEIEDLEVGGPVEDLIVEKIQNTLKKSS